jgi:hypothetical protein
MSLCRDYSSFIKWAISAVQSQSDKWTDFSVPEPDTLMLSLIATGLDYVQYMIDQKYLNTDLDLCSAQFLSQLSSSTGKILSFNSPVKIPIVITNQSNEDYELPAYAVMISDRELYSTIEDIKVAPKSTYVSYLTRGTIHQIFIEEDLTHLGEYIISGKIETGSLSIVRSSSENSTILYPCDDILRVLLGENQYQISSISDDLWLLKVSPPKNFTGKGLLQIRYTEIDDFASSGDLEFLPVDPSLVNENVVIKVQSPVNETSRISLNSNRLSYLNSLLEIDTVNNSTSVLNLDKMSSKIVKYMIDESTNNTFFSATSGDDFRSLALFKYVASDNRIFDDYQLLPNSISILQDNLTDMWYLKIQMLNNLDLPPYDLKIMFSLADGVEHIVYSYLSARSNPSEIRIDLPWVSSRPSLTSMKIYYDELTNPLDENQGLWCIYEDENTIISKTPEIDYFQDHVSSLSNRAKVRTLCLKPKHLLLSGTITIVDQRQHDVLTDVYNVVSSYLSSISDLITDTHINYVRLQYEIINNLSYIKDVKITSGGISSRLQISNSEYLVFDPSDVNFVIKVQV